MLVTLAQIDPKIIHKFHQLVLTFLRQPAVCGMGYGLGHYGGVHSDFVHAHPPNQPNRACCRYSSAREFLVAMLVDGTSSWLSGPVRQSYLYKTNIPATPSKTASKLEITPRLPIPFLASFKMLCSLDYCSNDLIMIYPSLTLSTHLIVNLLPLKQLDIFALRFWIKHLH